MKIFSFYGCAVALFLLSLASCAKEDKITFTKACDLPSSDSSSAHSKAALFQTVLEDYVEKGLPGIAVAVRDNSGLWMGAAGMADIEKDIPFEVCHISKAASITKMLVGTLAHLLVEDGVFNLEDPINKWLTDKQLKNIKNADRATIRQCLNHTTGIADVIKDKAFYLAVLNDPDKFWKEEELLDFVRGDDAVFPIGDSVKYSNTNTLLAGMVINAATGRHHSELIKERLIDRFGLNDTYYYWHEEPPLHAVAQGYFDLYNDGSIVNLTNYNTGSGNGYGGLYSTVLDLKNFVELLLREKTILKPESLNTMLTFEELEYGKNRRLGPGIMQSFTERAADQYAYGHSGRDLGYTADAFYFPNQDMTLTFVVNYGTDAESQLQPVFFDFRTAIVDAMMAR